MLLLCLHNGFMASLKNYLNASLYSSLVGGSLSSWLTLKRGVLNTFYVCVTRWWYLVLLLNIKKAEHICNTSLYVVRLYSKLSRRIATLRSDKKIICHASDLCLQLAVLLHGLKDGVCYSVLPWSVSRCVPYRICSRLALNSLPDFWWKTFFFQW